MPVSLPYLPSFSHEQLDADIAHLEKRLRTNPNDVYAYTCLVVILNYYTPKRAGLGAMSDCQREIVARSKRISRTRDFLDMNKVAEEYHAWNNALTSRRLDPPVYVYELFAGKIHNIGGEETYCSARMALFANEGIISNLCLDCYKVQIVVGDVASLIKMYFVLRNLRLPRDNTRKCMVETRKNVPNPYKAYIYCESEEEAERCRELLLQDIKALGIENVRCGFSHGCSEFGLKYPAYKYSEGGAHRSFERHASWDEVEAEYFRQNVPVRESVDHHNKSGITIHDVIGFRYWVTYSEIIGDRSCREFWDGPDFMLAQKFVSQAEHQAPQRQAELQQFTNELKSVS